MTVFNGDIRGRRVQVLLALDAPLGRSRGYWPRSGPWPIFRYWTLWRLELRVFTARCGKEPERVV